MHVYYRSCTTAIYYVLSCVRAACYPGTYLLLLVYAYLLLLPFVCVLFYPDACLLLKKVIVRKKLVTKKDELLGKSKPLF